MERAAVEDLYRTHAGAVLRRARAILGNEQAARDAMQDVFVRVLRSHIEFYEDTSPMTWLYRVTTNYCLNKIRDAARQRELLEQRGKSVESERQPDAETRIALAKILAKVPEDLREFAVYRYVDQMTYDEIAALTGVSKRTVGNRLDAFRTAARAAAE